MKLFLLLLFVVLVTSQECQSPYERCICRNSYPYCQCTYITSNGTFNYSSSYNSHLALVAQAGCRPCPSSCLKCSSPTLCSTCNDEFQLRNNVCSPCPLNCKKCSNGICSECIDGYYIDSKTLCQSCPLEGTLSCTIDSLKLCLPSYWLDNNGATCVKCDENCEVCSSVSKCETCLDGYYLEQYLCYECSSPCKTCSNSTFCLSCQDDGTYFQDGIGCTACSQNCLSCVDSQNCLECENGYNIVNGLCANLTTEIDGCASFSQNSTSLQCLSCSAGYYMKVGSTTCEYGCSVLCVQCRGPHYGLCYECISNTVNINLHCLPIYNIDDGSAFQLYYTASNNPDLFFGGQTVEEAGCFPQKTIGNSQKIWIQILDIQSYKVEFWWTVYIEGTGQYEVTLTNENANQTVQFNSFYCFDGCGVCVHKGELTVSSVLLVQNMLNFQVQQGTIGISQIFMKGYRCGGTEGITCAQCSEINVCTKCVNSNFYILGEKCVSECPSTYYTYVEEMKCYDICPVGTYSTELNPYCHECPDECVGCSSSEQCYSCEQGYFLLQITSQCIETCPSTYFPDTIRNVCEECLHPCYQCLSGYQCLSCTYGFYYNQTCVTVCQNNYYPNYQSVSCEVCHYPCETCQSPGNVCLQCADNYSIYGNQCLDECPSGYYSSNNTCEVCSEQCKTCKEAVKCLSCRIGFLLGQSCLLQCPSGYYSHLIDRVCDECPENCSECISHNMCTSCQESFFLINEAWVCAEECPATYYASKTECTQCQLPCNQCLSQFQCLSCIDSFHYQNQCLNECPSGYYGNMSQLQCLQCQSPCETCDQSAFYCITCVSGFYLIQGECQQNCSVGTYPNENICSDCENDCQNCLSKTVCIECVVGLIVHDGNCLDECPTFYFSTSINGTETCVLCNENCSICEGNADNCSQCIFPFVLDQNKCQSECIDKQFNLNGKCTACVPPCQTCTSEAECLSCTSGYLFQGQCFVECPDGYYGSASSKLCVQCDSTCLTCINEGYCLECSSGFYLNLNHTCQNTCLDGFYADNSSKKCSPCDQYCYICTDFTCIQCLSPYFLHDGSCFERCPIGYYDENVTICSSCSQNCLHCFSGNFCLTCQSGYFLDANNECVKECVDGYFEGSQHCVKCSYPCSSCTSETQCIECEDGFLFHSQCVENCPISSFLVNSTYCQSCSQNCLECTDASNCLSCFEGVLVDGRCQDNCPSQYYPNFGTCNPCIYGCSDCSDGHSCNECQIGFLFNGECISLCPIGMIESNSTCVNCSDDCVDCIITPDQCTSCKSGKLLYLKNCLEECPSGTYENQDLNQCITCTSPCQTCSNAFSCESCIYGYILYKEETKNQCVRGPSCPNSYFLASMDGNPVCKLQCDDGQYVEPISKTCSAVCPEGFVLFANNDTCLEQCPSGMWINEERQCSNSNTKPNSLPSWKCVQSSMRNILIFDCQMSLQARQTTSLTSSNVVIVPTLKIQQVNIISKDKFQILVSSSEGNLSNVWVKIGLIPRYTLEASSTGVSPFYPFQNHQTDVFIQIYHFYSISQRETGLFLMQISQSICLAAFIIWLFAFIRNKQVYALFWVTSLQFLYSLSLLSNSFAPNLKQFLQGFRLSMLVFVQIESTEQKLWTLDSIFRNELLYPYDLSNFVMWSISIFSIIGFAIFAFLFFFAGEKLYECSEVSEESFWYKIDRKLRILRKRFVYNYTHHFSHLLAMPTTLLFFMQVVSPSLMGLIVSTLLFFALICILVHSLSLSSSENSFSCRYLFVISIQNMLSIGLLIFCTTNLYVGMILIFTFLNLWLWKLIWKDENWKNMYCIFLDVCKLLIVMALAISQFKEEEWNNNTHYLYSWFPISLILLYTIFTAIFVARDFFQYEIRSSTALTQRKTKKTERKNKLLEDNEEDQEQEDEEQFFEVQSRINDYTESDEDIIDFQDSYDGERKEPPKHLIKIDK